MAVLLKHLDAPIPSLCAARSDVPAALDALFMGMLAKQPESRIASMTEVVKRLEQVQAELRNAATLAGTVVFQPSIQDLTVILVEPSRTQAGIVKKYLQDLGITRVHSTTSGAQGLETAKQQGGQVFICSLYLGDMTGMKLAEQVRADPTCANIAFVLATSGSEDEDVATIKAMPRTVLVSKPFDAKKLAVALAAATGCRS
jgi:CheY-like chemotaxis protein